MNFNVKQKQKLETNDNYTKKMEWESPTTISYEEWHTHQVNVTV